MELYVDLTNMLSRNRVDDVSLEEFKTEHPRETILIRRSNNIPYPMSVKTAYFILESGDRKDPITREYFSDINIRRIMLYYRAFQQFPNYVLNVNNLYERWNNTYLYPDDYTYEEKLKIRFEAKCFLQPEDLTALFESFYGDGSFDNRESAIQYLQNSNKNWILRKSSIKDTEFDKAYVLSKKISGDIYHIPIVHKIGDGFYYNVKIIRGNYANVFENYTDVFPTIIHLLEQYAIS